MPRMTDEEAQRKFDNFGKDHPWNRELNRFPPGHPFKHVGRGRDTIDPRAAKEMARAGLIELHENGWAGGATAELTLKGSKLRAQYHKEYDALLYHLGGPGAVYASAKAARRSTMGDKQLRSKLIRLAHENPELRPDLLPLIQDKQAAKTPPWVCWEEDEDGNMTHAYVGANKGACTKRVRLWRGQRSRSGEYVDYEYTTMPLSLATERDLKHVRATDPWFRRLPRDDKEQLFHTLERLAQIEKQMMDELMGGGYNLMELGRR